MSGFATKNLTCSQISGLSFNLHGSSVPCQCTCLGHTGSGCWPDLTVYSERDASPISFLTWGQKRDPQQWRLQSEGAPEAGTQPRMCQARTLPRSRTSPTPRPCPGGGAAPHLSGRQTAPSPGCDLHSNCLVFIRHEKVKKVTQISRFGRTGHDPYNCPGDLPNIQTDLKSSASANHEEHLTA